MARRTNGSQTQTQPQYWCRSHIPADKTQTGPSLPRLILCPPSPLLAPGARRRPDRAWTRASSPYLLLPPLLPLPILTFCRRLLPEMQWKMAAGQQKKRLSATSITRFNVHEQGKKKKRLESSDSKWGMKPHISLEWDDSQKKAVARKEQVAMSWMDLSPFVHPPQSHSGLADVFLVPKEIFELDNMSEVLSYEVWENHLSESEKNFLSQFLPKESDSNEVVLSLLMEENLNFGNPFNRWSSSLCSGSLHPDAVLSRDHELKARKKFYYAGLKKYHYGIIDKLQEWKKRWSSCKNPEKELFGSLIRKGVVHPVSEDSQIALNRPRRISVSTRDQRKKVSIDSAKYMSYLKISRRQHQLVKDIKHSSEGIPSKSLGHVLGDIKGFNLQPYEAFEEEEKERLHEHWLKLACKDLPAFFEYYKEQRELRELQRRSIVQELADKEETSTDEVEENMEVNESPEFVEDEESPDNLQGMNLEIAEDSDTHQPDGECQDYKDIIYPVAQCSMNHPQSVQSVCSPSELNAENSNETGEEEILNLPVEKSVQSCEATSSKCSTAHQSFCVQPDSSQDATRVVVSSVSTVNNHLERVPSLNGQQEFSPTITCQDERQGEVSLADGSIVAPHSHEETIYKPKVLESRASTSGTNIWADVGTRDTYHDPAPHVNTSTSELSLRQPCLEKYSAQLVNMKTDMLSHEAAGSVSSAMNLVNDTPLFGSYANQDRDILLPPFPKHQELLPSYTQEHLNDMKSPDVSFLLGNNSTQSGGFFPHFQDHQIDLIQQRQAREREIYMHQMTNREVYCDNPYLNHGNFSSNETHDWVSLPPRLNGGVLNHNMFPRDLQDRSTTMFGVEVPCATVSHSLGNDGDTNGSLFSVLPKFPSTFPCNISSSCPVAPSGVRTGDDIHGGFSANHQLNDSTRNQEIPATFKVDESSWMNLPRQNPNLHGPKSQPYMGPWNR